MNAIVYIGVFVGGGVCRRGCLSERVFVGEGVCLLEGLFAYWRGCLYVGVCLLGGVCSLEGVFVCWRGYFFVGGGVYMLDGCLLEGIWRLHFI